MLLSSFVFIIIPGLVIRHKLRKIFTSTCTLLGFFVNPMMSAVYDKGFLNWVGRSWHLYCNFYWPCMSPGPSPGVAPTGTWPRPWPRPSSCAGSAPAEAASSRYLSPATRPPTPTPSSPPPGAGENICQVSKILPASAHLVCFARHKVLREARREGAAPLHEQGVLAADVDGHLVPSDKSVVKLIQSTHPNVYDSIKVTATLGLLIVYEPRYVEDFSNGRVVGWPWNVILHLAQLRQWKLLWWSIADLKI